MATKAQVNADPNDNIEFEQKDHFDLDIAFPERIDPDERSAIATCTLKTKSPFPAGKVATNIDLLINLNTLPKNTTIGKFGSNDPVGQFAPNGHHVIAVGVPMLRPVSNLVPNGVTEKPIKLEIKTGLFAWLQLNPTLCKLNADLKDAPSADPITKHPITIRVTYDLGDIAKAPPVGTEDLQSITITVED